MVKVMNNRFTKTLLFLSITLIFCYIDITDLCFVTLIFVVLMNNKVLVNLLFMTFITKL